MKATTLRALIVAFAFAAFGFLAISPSRAQTSGTASSPTTTPSSGGGCCGSSGSSGG